MVSSYTMHTVYIVKVYPYTLKNDEMIVGKYKYTFLSVPCHFLFCSLHQVRGESKDDKKTRLGQPIKCNKTK